MTSIDSNSYFDACSVAEEIASEYDSETLLTRMLVKGMVDYLISSKQIETFVVQAFSPTNGDDASDRKA